MFKPFVFLEHDLIKIQIEIIVEISKKTYVIIMNNRKSHAINSGNLNTNIRIFALLLLTTSFQK